MCIKTMDKKHTRIITVGALAIAILTLLTVAFAAPAPTTSAITPATPGIIVDTSSNNDVIEPPTENTQQNLPPFTNMETLTPTPEINDSTSDAIKTDIPNSDYDDAQVNTSVTEELPIAPSPMTDEDFANCRFFDLSYENLQRIARFIDNPVFKSADLICTYMNEQTVSFMYENYMFCIENTGEYELGDVVTLYFIL